MGPYVDDGHGLRGGATSRALRFRYSLVRYGGAAHGGTATRAGLGVDGADGISADETADRGAGGDRLPRRASAALVQRPCTVRAGGSHGHRRRAWDSAQLWSEP